MVPFAGNAFSVPAQQRIGGDDVEPRFQNRAQKYLLGIGIAELARMGHDELPVNRPKWGHAMDS